ncbi:N-acetylglucosamine-6-phosphate deacetylase [Victivallis vadensis]|uniref:N-acetylglucosamine-6-phosphate deacetylase n=1 Tax=Victivallis vadensis TaxID=172901 RepID=UPI00307DA956
MKRLFTHARLVTPGRELEDAALMVDGDTIAAVLPAGSPLPAAEEATDLEGALLLPGFFDIHAHGGSGVDFCDATPEAVATLARHKLAEGVTSFLGTTLSLDEESLAASLRAAREYQQNPSGANIVGIHLEGPFFAPEFAGAQNPAHLKTPDIDLVDRLNAIFPIRKVSYSPELDPDFRFLAALVERGIIPSAGHTGAAYELFRETVKRGLRHLTHFCNCMTPLHHLHFGLVGGGLRHEETRLELICDGVHLLPEMVELIFRTAGPERVMLITDAMRAAGMPDGEYTLGELPVTVSGRRATLANGAVSGSTLRFHEALRNVRDWTGLPLGELVRCCGSNQAESLGIPGIGRLEPGFRADLVRLSPELTPEAVWIGGRPVTDFR